MKHRITLLIAFITVFSCQPKAIIFDLGGVLVYPSKASVFIHQIGPTRLINYSLHNNPYFLENDFITFLNSIKCSSSRYPAWKNASTTFPGIMHDWLCGTISSHEILNIIEKHTKTYTSCITTQDMFYTVSKCIFNPQQLIDSMRINMDGLRFVLECKKNGHSVYILSNWDSESFNVFKQRYPRFIKLFDGIVISGDIGHIKPDPFIYDYLLQKYAINPNDAFFIDDISHNTDAAIEQGIYSVTCKQKTDFIETKAHFPYVNDIFTLWLDAINKNKIINNSEK